MTVAHPQYRADGSLAHFLDFDGLSRETLIAILDTAESLAPLGERRVRTVPLLRGRTVANLFFENSTRTRTAFELAAKRLSADVLNIDLVSSSTAKGESLLDTLRVLESLQCDMFVVRHAQSGAARFIARHVAPSVAVINGGDGQHAHPTQGLLDVFTIRRHKPDFENLTVVLIGDIVHSRVARSDLAALSILGTGEIRVVGPRTLVPDEVASLGGRVMNSLDEALVGADVVMGLRLQRERMDGAAVPSSGEFFKHYGLTPDRMALAKPDAIVMHPGPTNRGVEIAAEIADGPQSVILEQVSAGLAIRMAVMSMVLGNRARDVAKGEGRNASHDARGSAAEAEARS